MSTPSRNVALTRFGIIQYLFWPLFVFGLKIVFLDINDLKNNNLYEKKKMNLKNDRKCEICQISLDFNIMLEYFNAILIKIQTFPQIKIEDIKFLNFLGDVN